MGHKLPPSLLSFFTRALKTFQLSKASFKVLCSLPSAPAPSSSEPAARPPQEGALQRLLVLDSSFNPPTLAHQRMALSALAEWEGRRNGQGQRVLLLLAINNADKAPKPAAFPQRLAMMYIFALDLLSALRASGPEEGERGQDEAGPGAGVDLAVTTEPYFHSKSEAIAADDFYGHGTGGVEQIYLTGFDTLIRIFDPKYYPDDSMRRALDPFFSHAGLRVTMRTDADWGGAAEQRAYLDGLRGGRLETAGGRREWANKVEIVDGRREGEEVVSSTKVRDAVYRQDWDKLRQLVSDDITAWIAHEKLYSEDAS
jgi:nicotinamide-nucleotide adenylyltransferase